MELKYVFGSVLSNKYLSACNNDAFPLTKVGKVSQKGVG